MARYDLLLNATAALSGAPPQGQSVMPDGPTNPKMPPLAQTFELFVTGVGNVSATAQIIVSNDNANWLNYGDPITAEGSNTAQAGFAGTQAWRHFAAYLTGISGTNASATIRMSA